MTYDESLKGAEEWYFYVAMSGQMAIKKENTLMLTNGISPDPLERNRRRQSLLRKYRKYAAQRTRAAESRF